MLWKENWNEAREHHLRWWGHDGLVVVPSVPLHVARVSPSRDTEGVDPGPPPSAEAWHADPGYVAARNHHWLANNVLALDMLPIGSIDLGPGSIALYLGSEPGFSRETVWFYPLTDTTVLDRPLCFDPNNVWWQRQLALIDAALEKSAGRYPVGLPDLIENLDILAAMRDTQTVMLDLLERPDWVKTKIAEINRIYYEVYDALHARLALPDGSCCFGAFHLWGPGRTAKV